MNLKSRINHQIFEQSLSTALQWNRVFSRSTFARGTVFGMPSRLSTRDYSRSSSFFLYRYIVPSEHRFRSNFFIVNSIFQIDRHILNAAEAMSAPVSLAMHRTSRCKCGSNAIWPNGSAVGRLCFKRCDDVKNIRRPGTITWRDIAYQLNEEANKTYCWVCRKYSRYK